VTVLVAGVVVLAVALRRDGGQTGGGARATADVVQQYDLADRVAVGAFSVRLLDGSTFDQRDLVGRVSVVNVWGSWCGPCRTEAPDLARVARQLGDRARFLGINVRDNPAAAQAFERSFDIPYPSVHPDDAGTAILSFGGALTAAAIPSTVVLDEEARIAARVVGPVDAATLRALVLDVAAQAR
jgi:thiol-disulfide isomerase/thioredoxin